MAKIENGELFLTKEESEHFIEMLRNPDKEVLKKRDAFFARCKIAVKEDGYVEDV